jgi:uncharacterized protein (TIRG00374 family)
LRIKFNHEIHSRLKTFATRLIGITLFVIALSLVDLRVVAQQIRQMAPMHLFCAFLACFGIILIKSFRWFILLRYLHIHISFVESIHISADANFWGTITPGRFGEFKRILHLKKIKKTSWSKAI